MNRGNIFTKGEIFHICNKSIASFRIFNASINRNRFIQALGYYNGINFSKSFSRFLEENPEYHPNLLDFESTGFIKFISYCIMPDHYHLIVKVHREKTISKYINDVENSYTRFFNIKFDRKGPLWQNRFKAVRINSNEQLLHVVRYVNINPTTSQLVTKPEDWKDSSYLALVNYPKYLKEVIREISISDISKFKKFCEDNIDYQKKLKDIKKVLLE